MAGGTCPQGHTSTWDDFCSVCGESMDPVATTDGASSDSEASAPAPAGNCANCSNPFGTEDVFCESCGYDFATGTLPEAESETSAPVSTPVSAPAPAAAPAQAAPAAEESESSGDVASASPTAAAVPAAAPAGSAAPTSAIIECDRSYFDEIAGDTDLTFPDPEPASTTVSLAGGKILIGRHNQSRGVYPEIDIDACTGDPAASTRHAMLREVADGQWTINDLGSTNGTMMSAGVSEGPEERTLLTPGTEVPLEAGARVFIGAFTRITLQ